MVPGMTDSRGIQGTVMTGATSSSGSVKGKLEEEFDGHGCPCRMMPALTRVTWHSAPHTTRPRQWPTGKPIELRPPEDSQQTPVRPISSPICCPLPAGSWLAGKLTLQTPQPPPSPLAPGPAEEGRRLYLPPCSGADSTRAHVTWPRFRSVPPQSLVPIL